MPPVVAMLLLAAGLPATARGDPQPTQAPLLPPIDPQVLAGRVLFAFGDEGLLVPPSRIAQDGSLLEVAISDEDLDAGVSSVLSLLSPTGTVYGLGDLHGAVSAKTKNLTLAGAVSIVPGSSFVLDDGLATVKGGQLSVRVEQSRFESADLGGVAVLASITVGGGSLELEGDVDGKYVPGSLSFDGTLALQSDFDGHAGSDETASADLTAGAVLDVAVKAGVLVKATFTDALGGLDVEIPSSKEPLRLGGSLTGKYENGTLDVDASLTLADPFTYRRDDVSATLSSGDVRAKVRNGQWRTLTLEDVAVDVDVVVDEKPLKLHGSIGSGVYRPAQGISFEAELEVVESFVYERDPVTATLSPGDVTVTVEDDRLKNVEFQGIEALVVITVEEKPLALKGTISDGSYEPGAGLSFDADLALATPFEWHKDDVTVTFQPGPVSVTLHQGKKHRWVKARQAGLPPLKLDLDDDDDEDDDGE